MRLSKQIHQITAALCLILPFSAQAQYRWITNDDSTLTITGYDGVGGDEVIPSTIQGMPVSGVRGFEGNTNLTGIILPDSITSVGFSAFSGCTALRSVTLGKGVESLWLGPCCAYDWQFSGCLGLTNFTVDPKNMNFSSRDGVLYNKSQDRLVAYPQGRSGSFAIPDTVLSITRAFESCTGLTSILIGNNLSYPPRFSGCKGLTNITVSTLNPNFSSRGGILFDKPGDVLLYYPEGRHGPSILPTPHLAVGFGFDIAGTANESIVVTVTTNLAGGLWTPIKTNVLANGLTSFVDLQWTNYPSRFYQTISP